MGYLLQFFGNEVVITAIAAWALAQIIKTVTDIIISKRFEPEKLFASGGMPSSHSSFVTSVTAMIGFSEGFDSNLFAVCFVMSMIVMYDAAGVRRAAGNQAKVINILIDELERNGAVIDKQLKEILGHTPFEVVAGAILGILIAVFVKFII